MKQKLLSKLLAIAMVLTLLPAGVFAEDAGNTNVAEVGGTEYATLQAAVDVADKKTVKLLENVELSTALKISADKTVTLDLNGKKLTTTTQSSNKSKHYYAIDNYGKFTLKDSSTEQSGEIRARGIENLESGKMIIESGTIVAIDTNGGAAVWNNADLTINGGVFKAEYEGASNDQYGPGCVYSDGTVLVTGGTFESANKRTYAFVSKTGTVTITPAGGKTVNISGAHGGLGIDGGTAIINGGNYSSSEYYGLYVSNDSCTANVTVNDGSFTGKTYSVLIGSDGKNPVDSTLTINGGTFGKPIKEQENAAGKLKVTGGTFSSDPSDYLADGYKFEMVGSAYGVVPDSAAVAQNGEKTFVSLQNAINDAKDNDTITLLKDVDLGATVTVANKTVTLNMAGKTIYNTKDLWDSKPGAWSLISVRENGNLTITGDGTLKAKADDCYALDTQEESAKLTVENGTVIGNISAIYAFLGEVTINGGSYSIQQLNTNNVQDGYGLTINCYDQNYKDKTAKITVTGGYFAHFDPANNKAEGAGTSFVADGYVSVTSDKSGYDYKVVQKTDTGSIVVKPAVADPEVTVSGSISKEDKQKVENAAKSVDVPTLGAAAGDKVAAISKTDAESLVAKAETLTNPTLYVQTALKVEPTAYDAANNTLALEITPQYRVVASTADRADEIKLNGDDKNAQVVQKYTDMTINTPTEVTMALPTGFAVADGDKLSIKHTKSDSTVEYYTGTVTEQGSKHLLTFTTNGFSPFVISAPAASIGENVYPTLQAAVDVAKDNDTIKLEQNVAADTKATVAKTVKFKVDTNSKTFDTDKNIVAGNYTTVKVTGTASPFTYEFTYIAPDYAPITKKDVKFDDVDVNAYYAPAVKWAVENKITAGKTDKLFAPDDTCTRGEMITFLWNAAGKPAAKNTTNPFTDVNAGAFYYDAVLWAVSNGITSGTSDTTFSPDNTVSRAQVVAFLYNYVNKPAAANSTFSDVAADAYYAPAVGWAAAQKITSGTGNNTFSPENDCTRAQIVTFLYNDLAK